MTDPSVEQAVARLGPGDRPWIVACSGGRDSLVLLHSLRFAEGGNPGVVAVHVDHAMREESASDARWLGGLCRAWGVPYVTERLDPPPRAEADARDARYAVLLGAAGARNARGVLTAHHADDQAETVLFRALRGTGLGGLRGIRPVREDGVRRPLLRVPGADLARYARAHRLRWRTDPTNAWPRARNVLRHEILPRVADAVTPEPVRALVDLAERAAADEEGWASLMPVLLEPLDPQRSPGRVAVRRAPLADLHPAVRARVLRALAREVGPPLSAAGTRTAVEFTTCDPRLGGVDLGGGIRMVGRGDRMVLQVGSTPVPQDTPPGGVPLTGVSGTATLALGGRRWRVRWDPRDAGPDSERVVLDREGPPVAVRRWRPGDRVRMVYGTKKLKKVFLEAGVPVEERHRLPVVADDEGAVLWVPGVVLAAESPRERPLILHIGIHDADSD